MSAYHYTGSEFWYRGAAGYSLYAYRIGTVTPISFYTNAGKTSTLTWPVIVNDDGNGNGRIIAYLDEDATIVLKDLNGEDVEGFPMDWIKPATQGALDLLALELEVAEEHIATINNSLDSALADISSLQGNVANLDGRLTAAEGTIVSHTSTLGTHTSQIGALQSSDSAQNGTLSTHTGQIAALQGTVSTHTSQIGVLQGRDDGQDATLASHTSTLGTHTGQIAALQAADTVLSGRLDALEAAVFDEPTAGAAFFRDPNTGFTVRMGDAATGGGGTGTVTFAGAFTAAPRVLTTAMWVGSEMVIIKLTGITTTAFTTTAGTIDSDGFHAQAVAYEWIAVGFS